MKAIIENAEDLPQSPNTVLETNSRDKTLNKLMRDTIVDLKNLIREKNLDGLTACQIGVNERIMVMRFGDNDLQSYINPVIVNIGDIIFNRETCIHIKNKQFLVPRYKTITLMYETPLGQVKQARFAGKASYVAQHLLWHMDGMFIDDVGLEIDDDWDRLTDEEKTVIIKEYAESLDIKSHELNDELKNSEEGRKLLDAIEFEKAVMRGDVTIKEEQVSLITGIDKKETKETKADEDIIVQEE